MIPNEIREFFNSKGRILIIKGNAGTGKTLLGVQLLRELDHTGEGIWVFSRDLDYSERNDLEAIRPKRRRMDARRSKTKMPKARGKIRGAPPTPVEKEFQPYQDIIAEIYQEVAKTRNPPLVVIDSYEGLSIGMSEDEKEHLKYGLISLARDTDVNIAMIMEAFEPNPLDYLADGVVHLKEDIIDDRRVRFIHLDKLRGTLIRRPNYLFTLSDGNFRYFQPTELDVVLRPFDLKLIPDTGDKVSSGLEDFDSLLGGGYQRGGAYFFEVDSNIPNYINLANLLVPQLTNHLRQDRGLIYIPPGLQYIGILFKLLSTYVDKKLIERNTVALCMDKTDPDIDIKKVTAKGKSLEEDMRPVLNFVSKHRKKGPNLYLIIADTPDMVYGTDATQEMLGEIMSSARIDGDIMMIIARDRCALSQRIPHFTNMHWKLKGIKDSILFYGIMPRTEMIFLSTDRSSGSTLPRFVSIV